MDTDLASLLSGAHCAPTRARTSEPAPVARTHACARARVWRTGEKIRGWGGGERKGGLNREIKECEEKWARAKKRENEQRPTNDLANEAS